MANWNFKETFNVQMKMQLYANVNVLGQVKNAVVCTGYLLFRNINFGLVQDSGSGQFPQIYAGSVADETITVEEHLQFAYGADHFINLGAGHYSNKGLSSYNDGRMLNYIVGSWNGYDFTEAVTNPFFDYGTLKNKAIDKKVIRNGADSVTFDVLWYSFNSLRVYDANGNNMPITKALITFDIPTSGLYTMKKGYNVGNVHQVDCSALKLVSEAFPESYAPNKIDFRTVYINRLYDSDDATTLTKVNVYNYNDVITLTFDYPEDTKHIGLRWDKSDWAKLENDNIFKLTHAYQTVGAKKQITFTGEQLLDVYGGLGKEIYLYVSAYGVGNKPSEMDYFAGYGVVAIDGNDAVAVALTSYSQAMTITLHEKGELPPDAESDDEKNDGNNVDGDDPPSGHTPTSEKEVGLNLMTTTYLLSDTQLKEIGNELWSANFMDNILMLSNSPIENILSCKIFPTTFSGVASAVKIGNVTMLNGAAAQKISASGLSKETGAITFPQKYNSFLDFAPFTNARIFIPFVGFQPLPVANFIGAQLSLRYVFDVVTGAVTVYLLRNGAVFDKYSGICAVDVPITASNRAQVEVGQIQSAITAGAQLATGNIGGALSAGLAIATTPNHFNTRGNAGGYTSQYDPRKPYLIIDRPKAQSEITSYGKTNGFPCNLTKTLNTLSGFTSVHDVHLDDVPCIESERQELKSIMQKGFVI